MKISWLNHFRFKIKTVPLALFAACFFSYGLLIPSLGFYWDDLPYIYSYHIFGPLGYGAYVAGDRPFSHYLYIVTTFFFGENPLGYHILNFLVRWGTCLAIWGLIRLTWQKNWRSLVWVPFLFAVYPGFRQQQIPIIYGLHWANYLQITLSFGLMVLAVRQNQRRWLWTGLAMLLSLSVFSLEYYIGLELIRPLLLWLVLGQSLISKHERMIKLIQYWLPYLAILVAYIIWRVILFRSDMYQPELLESIGTAPQLGIIGLVQTVFQDFFKVTLYAWEQITNPLLVIQFASRVDFLYWGIIAATLVLFILYFSRLDLTIPDAGTTQESTSYTPASQAVLLGIWAVLSAGFPFWVSYLPIEIRFPFDRFTLPFIFGVSMLLGGLAALILRTHLQKAILIGLMIAFAVGWQFQNANSFRRDWENLSTFLWQFTWRVPGLQPGTIAMTQELPLLYYSDGSLTPLLNMIYAPQNTNGTLSFLMLFIKARLGSSLPSLEPGTGVKKTFRTFSFSGTTSQTLGFYYSPPGCFRILDPSRAHELADMPVQIGESLHLSRLDLIKLDKEPAAVPVSHWFGGEPAQDWCYYYEKADLARQKGDWQAAANLADQAYSRFGGTKDATEQAVFIEAYARNGQIQKAVDRVIETSNAIPSSRAFLCTEWKYLEDQLGTNVRQEQVRQKLSCR
jgi:hypothetical protein